jgi:short-subunit dehydrogenase
MKLEGAVCVVTGVSKGIGYQLVKQLIDQGSHVVGLGRTAPDITDNGFRFIKTDVRDYQQVEKAFDRIYREFGDRVDVLINNAGLGYFGYLEDHTLEQWHSMFETNVNGIFYTSRLAVPVMKKQERGHIVNIASTAAIEGYPQVSGYCGTKFAVKGMSQSMYKEMRDFGIKVTCVYPGSVKTDFFRNSAIEPHDYMLMPEDVAQMIVQALQTSDNFHQVNLEVRPLQPRGPRKKD